MTDPIPRALARYPLGGRVDGPIDRWRAQDRERGTVVVVSRVAFDPGRRKERDALVERVRALFTVTAPALVTAVDAGAWDDDAFVVEESVIEPRAASDAIAELDPRERALAARALAEGVARLHEAGWSIDSLEEADVVIDAYRQPRLSIAQRTIPASEATRASDVRQLRSIVSAWTSVGSAPTAAELARFIAVPEVPTRPLLPAAAPPRVSPVLWVLVVLSIAAALAYLVTR